MKITGGQWRFNGKDVVSDLCSDGPTIAFDIPNAADGRLLAAAPRMLELLRCAPMSGFNVSPWEDSVSGLLREMDGEA